jgi:hypothetical protein
MAGNCDLKNCLANENLKPEGIEKNKMINSSQDFVMYRAKHYQTVGVGHVLSKN